MTNLLKSLKLRFIHNTDNPSFTSVWVCSLINGIPGNFTEVQLTYSWTEYTNHSQRSVGQSAQGKEMLIKTEMQQMVLSQ